MKAYIMQEVLEKIKYFVKKADGEVSGLGVIRNVDGNLVVVDAVLLEQECSSSSTDLDEKAVAKVMYEMRNVNGDLNFWWHSHANMGVFWSGTDDTTIKEIGNNGYCLASVFNKAGEIKTRFYQRETDVLPRLDIDNLTLELAYSKNNTDKWDKEFTDKVKAKTYSCITGSEKGHWYDYDPDDDDANTYAYYRGGRYYYGNDTPTKAITKAEKKEAKRKSLLDIEEDAVISRWSRLPEPTKELWRNRYLHYNYCSTNVEKDYAEFYDEQRYYKFTNKDWQDCKNDYEEFLKKEVKEAMKESAKEMEERL